MGLSTVNAFKHIHSSEDGIIVLSGEQLRQLQRVLNGMLADVDACCRRHGLQYVLGGGSCLGAVRHHGFIPWDDDIDINMPRADYLQFIAQFREEYGDRYWIHTPQETTGYGLTLSRVLLKGTCVRTREDFHNHDECGAFIDIFVIENTYDNPVRRRLHGLGCMAMGLIQSCSKFWRDRKELTALAQAIEDPEERKSVLRTFRIKIALGTLTAFRSTDAWTKATDRMYARCRESDSRYVTIPSGKGHFFGELYLREQLLPGIPVDYDGSQRPVPPDCDGYLRRLYGDYRKLPTEEQKESHIFFAPFQL